MFLLTIYCLLLSDLALAFTTTDSTNLHTALFNSSYSNYVRPSELTSISIEFVIFSLNELNIKSQVMSTSGWLTIVWTDDRLQWTAASYSNTDYIYTKQAKIWKPELIIDNSIDGMVPLGDDEFLFRIKNTGEVRWDPPGLYNTHCDIDITYFPFDYQLCKIEVASWAYTMDKVNLTKLKTHINTEEYNENGEWELYDSQVEEGHLTEDGEYFAKLEFKLTLKRRPGYYMSHILFPIILVSLLTNVTFILPADSGEKISYILTVLLALAVLLTLIGDNMPTTSKHTSILSIYLSIVLSMATIVILITVLNLRLYLRADQKDVPKWLKVMTDKVLLKFACHRSKVSESGSKVEELRSRQNTVHITELADADLIVNEKGQKKTLKRMSRKENKNIAGLEDKKIDETEFPFLCRDVSGFLDCFLFHLFNIIALLATVIFLAVVGTGKAP